MQNSNRRESMVSPYNYQNFQLVSGASPTSKPQYQTKPKKNYANPVLKYNHFAMDSPTCKQDKEANNI